MDPQVTVVIVTFESMRTIADALNHLQEAHQSGVAQVVLVDNASSDGTAQFVEQHYPWVNVIANDWNAGFGRACNIGIDISASPYILLLNPDASLPLPEIQKLVQFMEENPSAALCAPAIQEDAGSHQSSGALTNPWRVLLKPLLPRWAGRGQHECRPGEAPFQTDWLCGAILLSRREAIQDFGGFDPRFFLYFEETDLCMRALNRGWELWSVGTAVGRHLNGASAAQVTAPMMWGTISQHYFQSRFYYLVKHFGWPAAVSAEVGEVAFMALRASIDRLRGRQYPYLKARLQAPILKLPAAAPAAPTASVAATTR